LRSRLPRNHCDAWISEIGGSHDCVSRWCSYPGHCPARLREARTTGDSNQPFQPQDVHCAGCRSGTFAASTHRPRQVDLADACSESPASSRTATCEAQYLDRLDIERDRRPSRSRRRTPAAVGGATSAGRSPSRQRVVALDAEAGGRWSSGPRRGRRSSIAAAAAVERRSARGAEGRTSQAPRSTPRESASSTWRWARARGTREGCRSVWIGRSSPGFWHGVLRRARWCDALAVKHCLKEVAEVAGADAPTARTSAAEADEVGTACRAGARPGERSRRGSARVDEGSSETGRPRTARM